MENETSDRIEGNAAEVNENTIVLRPVPLNASGEGLPYAPQDWPLPGDNWRWKVGRRITPKGFHVDRYLYLPTRFQVTTMKKKSFKSKLSVQQYVEKEFPGVDIDGFFASFSWKIPYKLQPGARGNDSIFSAPIPIEVTTVVGSDSQSGTGGCKAGNNICISLLEEGDQLLTAIDCDICCSEPGFCRECCCILCCKIVSLAYGGYSFVKCESKIDKNFICGHVAHIECALRSYMAGTVGGSIGLDAEYYCRLCDARTELISHVTRLLQTCKTLESQDEIEKILNLGVCILRGSQKQIAKGLLNRIESAIAKLKSGTCIGEVWKEDEYTHDAPSDPQNDHAEVASDLEETCSVEPQYLELEEEIDQVLYALRKSQQSEYELAEERLNAHKSYLLHLYQQLDNEKTEILRCTPSNRLDALRNSVSEREDQIKRETAILRDMEKVAGGFGLTSKSILRQHFGLGTD